MENFLPEDYRDINSKNIRDQAYEKPAPMKQMTTARSPRTQRHQKTQSRKIFSDILIGQENGVWMLPQLSRTYAEKILNSHDRPIGSYFVRRSQTQPGYALSVKLGCQRVGHFIISTNSRTNCVKLWKLKFESIAELVEYFESNPIYESVRLVKPLKTRLRMARCIYDSYQSSQWELSIHQGEEIVILQYLDRNWYLGMNANAEIGIIPRNFIEIEHAYAVNNNHAHTTNIPRDLRLPIKREKIRRDSVGISTGNSMDSTGSNPPTIDLIQF